jgi:hypothetical protein
MACAFAYFLPASNVIYEQQVGSIAHFLLFKENLSQLIVLTSARFLKPNPS